MLSVLNLFRGRRATRPAPRTLLRVEGMEDRTVPTVVFNPAFGSPTVNAFDPARAIKSPQVHLVFVGSYWTTPTGANDVAGVTQDVRSLLASPYLSKLTQYGSDGKATFGVSSVNPAAAPWNGGTAFTQSDLVTAVQQQFTAATGRVPAPGGGSPVIYVAITDPNAVPWNSSYGGYNWGANYTTGSTTVPMNMVWVRTGHSSSWPGVNRDGVSLGLSHELAERMASNVTLTPSASIPANMIAPGSGRQISDLETDGGNYTYRLNGVLVQSYWSKEDNGYVVPDSHPETKISLNPIWPAKDAAGNASFPGKYDLLVTGDQGGANATDTVDLRAGVYFGSGTTVTLNGETADFDPGVIRTIKVDPLGGTNSVRVEQVEAGVTVNVVNSNTGGNTDTVTVGTYWGSLVGIAGPVNVSNTSGHTKLVIDDSGDPTGQSVTVGPSFVTVGSAQINYTAGSGAGVNEVDLKLGIGGNTVFAIATDSAAPVWVYANHSDVRIGPAAYQLHWITPVYTSISVFSW
jgi:hypothetical protein